MVGAYVLVGDELVPGGRRIDDLLQQKVGLADHLAGGKRPVGTHTLSGHARGFRHAGVVMPARGDQPPQPGQRLGQHVHHPDDAVGRRVFCAGRRPDAETAHIDLDGLAEDARHMMAREDHPRVGAGLAGLVHGVLPDQAGGSGHAFDVQKNQRLLGVNSKPLVLGIGAVTVDVVDTQEPSLLGVLDDQLSAGVLDGGVAQRHVVGHRQQVTGIFDVKVHVFARQDVAGQQGAAVRLLVHLLDHFALSAAAGAFVQDDQAVVIGGDDLHCRAVQGQPAFLLPDVDQHAVDALFSARAGIKVEGEDLVNIFQAVVHDDLLAAEMRMAERRRQIDDSLGFELLGQGVCRHKALKVGHGSREECRVLWGDQQGGIAQIVTARHKGQEQQLLLGQPLHGILAQGLKAAPEPVLEARFIRGLLIGDHHAVRIPSSHIHIGVVDRQPVAALADDRLADIAYARKVVAHLETAFVFSAHGQGEHFFSCLRDQDIRRNAKKPGYIIGQDHVFDAGHHEVYLLIVGGGSEVPVRGVGCLGKGFAKPFRSRKLRTVHMLPNKPIYVNAIYSKLI